MGAGATEEEEEDEAGAGGPTLPGEHCMGRNGHDTKKNHERIKVSGIGAGGPKNNVGMWIPWNDDSAASGGLCVESEFDRQKNPKNTH